MAHFLLFVFVVATQLMGAFSSQQRLAEPEYGNIITVLSIDGGGIKGILPATVLDHLDKALKVKDPDASLAKYFDVIAGTSTGGLVAAMLASPSPDDPNRPGFTPAKIIDFYKNYGPKIFSVTGIPIGPFYFGPFYIGPYKIDQFQIGPYYFGAKFNGEALHGITRELLNETRLNETLTNVVIPTFDMKRQKPVIFSSYKVEEHGYLNAKVADICIGTSAAPSQLPAYYFNNDGVDFNLIDGAVAAGNPTEVALSEVTRHSKGKKIVVLSVGTGVTKIEEKYDAAMTSGWLDLQWTQPLLEFVGHASTDMNEYYQATLFSGQQPDNKYLISEFRYIKEYDLDPSVDDSTNASIENMNKLEDAGKELLQKNVVRINLDTFEYEETGEGTYAEALDRLADILYEEKELRLKRKLNEKKGRPFIEAI